MPAKDSISGFFIHFFRIDNVNGCAMILKTKKEIIFQGDCFMKALSSNERLLILINCFYNLANAMSAVFMNVYLYAYTGSLVVMSIYTIVRIGLYPFFFTIGGKWAQRHRFSQTLTAGLVLIMISLLFRAGRQRCSLNAFRSWCTSWRR